MPAKSALFSVLRETTLDALRSAGQHDAVIVGAGAAGGLAAMLLAERVACTCSGCGRTSIVAACTFAQADGVTGPTAFITDLLGAIALRSHSESTRTGKVAWTVASACPGSLSRLGRSPWRFRLDDRDCPYLTPADRPFVWIGEARLGGRMSIPGHGRQYYRLGAGEFLSQ